MIVVVHAHPYPRRSRATAALLAALDGMEGIEVRRLYDLYPDFDIDVAGEHAVLRRASAMVWLHPFYWYSVPALLKHWFDAVLLTDPEGDNGRAALQDKRCLWATTTGRGEYSAEGPHRYPFEAFAAPIEMTARYCGMAWEPPFVLHDGVGLDDEKLRAEAARFGARVAALGPGRSE